MLGRWAARFAQAPASTCSISSICCVCPRACTHARSYVSKIQSACAAEILVASIFKHRKHAQRYNDQTQSLGIFCSLMIPKVELHLQGYKPSLWGCCVKHALQSPRH